MGLLSIFTRPRDEESPRETSAAERTTATPPLLWRCGAFYNYALGEQIQAVHFGSGAPLLLPSFAVEFAASCFEWRTMEGHIAYFADRHGWDMLQVDGLREALPELQEKGLLISNQRVLEKLGSSEPEATPPPKITSLGFPTGGNRVATLERSIRSFAANLKSYGRDAEFRVADSSSNPEHTEAFRTRLRELSHELGIAIRFCGPADKVAFGKKLADAGACSFETAEFALLDPLGTGFACGSNRNALLLQGAGTMICSIDDDVVCDLFRPPDRAGHQLALFSNRDPYSRWLFSDLQAADAFAIPEQADFLGAHERLLGRPACECVGGIRAHECDVSQLRDRILERLDAPDLRIRTTFAGHLGDPGIPTSIYYLYYDGENRRRLTETEEHYRSVFPSRSVQTIVTSPSIGDASVCPGMAMGWDHRQVLPPSFPVLHAEDFSWGAAVWQCCGSSLVGHLPLAIRHAPPNGKPILTPDGLKEDERVVVFEWAHLLRFLILDFRPAASHSPAQRMSALGDFLLEIAGLPPRDFGTRIGKLILALESQRISWLERELREDVETPDYWRADLERHIDHVRRSLAHDDFDIPLDLKPGRTPEAARAFMQTALGRYGQLLKDWPAMFEACISLRARGVELFPPALE